MQTIALVDYGLANIRSVYNALECFRVNIVIAENGQQLREADKIVLPGVGSFDAGMRGIRSRGHEEVLSELVLRGDTPFLGICLGLQFLFEGSEEGEAAGLGWLPGKCAKFPTGPSHPIVPHMGWNDIEPVNGGRLLSELHPPLTFYFVHSYYAPANADVPLAATCEHGLTFCAAVERDNIMATQFHPEKSQLAGLKLLETFLTKL
ncbi:imidazole glycerol phosphate synthase subunit HisH [Desulfohalovibrio reitneri]|uniref:imidazole glycerol phosphate synthase subunit HisH n=1 Tax=Desulfohalovibrio reitneri TaxID=1307759 RepID=UPI0004A73FEB|nr:imidazole glycerol phosphate synthase subunit HisH [Desulfohalovibrio reitneri]